MEEVQSLTKGAHIQRLLKLQKALILPEDQRYHDQFEAQMKQLKADINAEKPLDQQITGLESAITRKKEKRLKSVQEINRLTEYVQLLDTDIVEKENLLASIKQMKLTELNLPQQQQAGDPNAQVQLLMQQVNQLQNALNRMAQNAVAAGGSTPHAQDQQQAAAEAAAVLAMTSSGANTQANVPAPQAMPAPVPPMLNQAAINAAINAAPATPVVSTVAPGTPGQNGTTLSLESQSSVWSPPPRISPQQSQEDQRAMAINCAQQGLSMQPFRKERISRADKERSPRRSAEPPPASISLEDSDEELLRPRSGGA